MIVSRNKAPDREDIEALLPWHAAGTLSRRDAERVEQALAQDPELARRFELVREEMAETIHLNETLGAPSTRAAQRLFDAIDAEDASKQRRTLSFDLTAWVVGFMSQLSPRTLAWASAAAVVALVLQAGLLAGLFVSQRGATYQTASYGEAATTATGAFALVRFNPSATAATITTFLDTHKALIADGPRAGGVYRIRVAAENLSKDELARRIGGMAEDKNVVAFIVPAN